LLGRLGAGQRVLITLTRVRILPEQLKFRFFDILKYQ